MSLIANTDVQYKVISSTITTGTSNFTIDLGAVYSDMTITLATASVDLGVRLNATTNDLITVNSVSSAPFVLTDFQVSKIYLTNTSGTTISYQIIVTR